MEKYKTPKRENDFHYMYEIPLSEPVEYVSKKLPLDPYVLGLLLGDGCFVNNAITFSNVEYDVIKFTGSTDTVNDYISFVVKGNPFSGIPQTVTYYIKPKNIYEELFYNGLDEFEYYLLNRMTYPKYTSIFSFPPLNSISSVLVDMAIFCLVYA
jgi:hypothetical protein